MSKLPWLLLAVPGLALGQLIETTVQWEAANPGVTPPWEVAASFPTKEEVFRAHDRFPGHRQALGHDGDVTTPDNECNENHNLQPDGDNDCDDPPPKSIPEPATLGLLALGLGGLMFRRRKSTDHL